ncbi:MAG: hypothetical protein LBV43_09310 [Prevotella sp.]|jgi:hypothetical protein|nr:hypothetical protein [Prevotella sp.]
MNEAYRYLFYKIYKSIEYTSSPSFWSEWKASIVLTLALGSLLYSFILYYQIFIDRTSNLGGKVYFILPMGIIIFLFNYYTILSKDQWKHIIEFYDNMPKKKNRMGSIIALIVIVFCFFSTIFAFYLMSQIDWSLYK